LSVYFPAEAEGVSWNNENMKNLMILITLLAGFIFSSCSRGVQEMSQEEYVRHIEEWDNQRLQRLKAPDGWINLAGLHWLNEGENRVGSLPQNDIVLPGGPANLGIMILEGNRVIFDPAPAAGVVAEGKPVEESITIFDEKGSTVLLNARSLGMNIIRRGERFGIRLRDYEHPRLEEFQKIERYPADRNWIVRATFIETDDEMTIRVSDVLGDMSEEQVPGVLEFIIDGETFRLFPTGTKNRLFIIFADETSGLETYGGGRFLYTDGPDREGYVYIDFNKAYNPPCAISQYTTCPLPPRENILPVEITAGEKAVD
jgi:uncharacterized protein